MATAAVEERVARLEGRVGGFEGRFDTLEHGLQVLGARIDGVEHRFTTRIDSLDQKIDRNFRCTMGVNVALWSSILVAVLLHA